MRLTTVKFHLQKDEKQEIPPQKQRPEMNLPHFVLGACEGGIMKGKGDFGRHKMVVDKAMERKTARKLAIDRNNYLLPLGYVTPCARLLCLRFWPLGSAASQRIEGTHG
ncbi:Protein of unknown function [Gryllus bimaculatus]|nr:Protein of unknown function [Gryllus bimaculatus]